MDNDKIQTNLLTYQMQHVDLFCLACHHTKFDPDFFDVGDLKQDGEYGNCSTDAKQEEKAVRLFAGEGRLRMGLRHRCRSRFAGHEQLVHESEARKRYGAKEGIQKSTEGR